MDWANETYVRLYVRDTTTWKMLPWQARLLIPAIMRKLDRSGVVDLGEDGEEGLAALVEVPVEFLRSGLPELLRRRVFAMSGSKLVMPNFLAAQETRQSDAQRKRESRERERALAMVSPAVTSCPQPSEPVTDRPNQSQQVTLSLAKLSLAELSSPPRACDPRASATEHVEAEPASDPRRPTGYSLMSMFGAIRREILNLQCPPGAEQPKDAKGKASAFAEQLTPDEQSDVQQTMRLACQHIRDGDDGWVHPSMTDPGFAFATWMSKFPGLREEVHGVAPKATRAKEQQRSGQQPRATYEVLR